MINEPRTYEEHLAAAAYYRGPVRLNLPLVIDRIDNAVEGKYISHPLRLYVVDAAGRVSWVGGLGSRNFDTDRWRREIEKLI